MIWIDMASTNGINIARSLTAHTPKFPHDWGLDLCFSQGYLSFEGCCPHPLLRKRPEEGEQAGSTQHDWLASPFHRFSKVQVLEGPWQDQHPGCDAKFPWAPHALTPAWKPRCGQSQEWIRERCDFCCKDFQRVLFSNDFTCYDSNLDVRWSNSWASLFVGLFLDLFWRYLPHLPFESYGIVHLAIPSYQHGRWQGFAPWTFISPTHWRAYAGAVETVEMPIFWKGENVQALKISVRLKDVLPATFVRWSKASILHSEWVLFVIRSFLETGWGLSRLWKAAGQIEDPEDQREARKLRVRPLRHLDAEKAGNLCTDKWWIPLRALGKYMTIMTIQQEETLLPPALGESSLRFSCV